MSFERIQDRAIGRWKSLLPQLGVPLAALTGKHTACPICGGKDRFRFDDKRGSGSFFCNGCGAGSGVDLVMKLHKVPFIEAKKLIEQHLPDTQVITPKPVREIDNRRWLDLWRAARPLNGNDPASWHLARRGLTVSPYPTQLRFMPQASYQHDDKSRTDHPAMLALFVSPDMSTQTVHFTYLDGSGRKADVPKVRKLAPGKVPVGGAVRLAPSAETMGIAEGIETALAAAQLFGVPVWAALTAGALTKWQPPATARNILIFADNDESLTGQHAAYALGYRLKHEGFGVEVRMPDEMGCDWNDVVMSEGLREAAE